MERANITFYLNDWHGHFCVNTEGEYFFLIITDSLQSYDEDSAPFDEVFLHSLAVVSMVIVWLP